MSRTGFLLILIAPSLAHCTTEMSDRDGPVSAVLEVQLATPNGEPLVSVGWNLWPDPDSGDVAGGMTVTSPGTFAVPLGRYDSGMIDSLAVFTGSSACSGFDWTMVTTRRGLRLHSPADTIRIGPLTPARDSPPARLALGAACAESEESQFSYFQLALWFDDISDSVRGRWRKNYQASFGDHYGYLAGTRVGNTLSLVLTLVNPFGACTSYDLVVPIVANDTLAQGVLTSPGCPELSDQLHFTEGEFLSPLLPPLPWGALSPNASGGNPPAPGPARSSRNPGSPRPL